MSTKKKNSSFAMVPLRIFALGISPYALATFAALRSFGDKNARDIFPKWGTLQAMTSQSKERLWKSLNELREAKVIDWKSGGTGVANEYFIYPQAEWKLSPMTLGSVRHTNQVGSPSTQSSVRHTNQVGSPGETQLDPVNKIHGTRSSELLRVTAPNFGEQVERMKAKAVWRPE